MAGHHTAMIHSKDAKVTNDWTNQNSSFPDPPRCSSLVVCEQLKLRNSCGQDLFFGPWALMKNLWLSYHSPCDIDFVERGSSVSYELK